MPTDGDDTLTTDGPPPRRLAGRYRLVAPIGRGGFGEVWRAVDEATGVDVAVKLPHDRSVMLAERTRREVAALRLVRHPGVVQLLDAGVDDGQLFIVMELARGTPFPGVPVPAPWERVAPAALALLQALRGVHATGIVHRDLKPANVLVDGDRVTLLDFGIARGPALGGTITARHAWVGSPLYLAPEQLSDRPKDARTDLYAVGVMLYEALCGDPPFRPGSMEELLVTRTRIDAPPLRGRAHEVPERVAAVVDRLLRRDPAERLPHAEAVLDALGAPSLGRETPWLGPTTVVDALVQAGHEGRPLDLGGAPGTGRSRTLREAVSRLRAGGLSVHLVAPARVALGSLRAVVGEVDGADPREEIDRRVRALLAAGHVFVVDDPDRVDWASRPRLEAMREVGAVLRVVHGPGDVQPEALDERDLRVLFHGPEVLHHLPTDGARALYRRTAALPARIAAELDAWVFAGFARWDGDRLRTDRVALEHLDLGVAPRAPVASAPTLDATLDELLGWVLMAGPGVDEALLARATEQEPWAVRDMLDHLRSLGAVRDLPGGRVEAVLAPAVLTRWTEDERLSVHRRLAGALAPGSLGRLAHLAGAKDLVALADEALVVGRTLVPEGRLGTAVALLELGLQALRGANEPEREHALARELTRAALAEASLPVLRRVRFAVAPVDPRFGGLVEAWSLAQGGDLAGACAVPVDPLPEDEDLDAYRHLVQVRRLAAQDPDDAELRIASVPARPGGALDRRKREWLGQVRFLAGRYAEAAELHLAAAEAEPLADRRGAALINAGLALREAYAYERSLACFEAALALAVQIRIPALEAWARLGVRSLLYRLDRAGPPDLDLVDASRPLGLPNLHAQIAFNEAVVAWRRGETELARTLALEALEGFDRIGQTVGRALSTALAKVCGAEVEVGWVLEAELDPPHAFQVAALLRAAGDARGQRWLDRVRPLLDHVDPSLREMVYARSEVE